MKIGLVLDDTLDTPDGVQQYVLHVGAWLSAQGHEVHYLVGQTTRADLKHVHSLSRNLRVKFNGNRMSMPLPASRRRLRAFLAEQQFDVLHLQMPYSPFMAGRLLRTVPPTTAVIGTFHILPYSRFVIWANRGLALLNRRSAQAIDIMLAVSPPAAEFARRMYGYDCKISPNPVDAERYLAARSDSASLTIVFLGRLVARKGAHYLLQAVALMREQELFAGEFQVRIGGKGALLPHLKQFVAEHQLDDVVTFEGFIDEAAKPAFLAQADIAVYPSTGGESFGIVLLEAMAAARGMVLAGNNPGYASVMAPYPDQLVDPRDIPAFAAKLAHYLSDAQARQAAATAQKTYVRRYDINQVGRQLLEVYAQALQRHKAS